MNYGLLASFSFGVGIMVGLTGVGGASLITPMLILVFKVPTEIAIGSDVVAATLMKVVGGVKHWRQQTLDPTVVKWMSLGSVPGALSGVAIFHLMKDHWSENWNQLLLRVLGGLILSMTLLGMGQLILSRFFPAIQLPTLPCFNLDIWSGRLATLAIGALLGFFVGLTSVSSGSMFALVLMAFFQLDARKLVGTDLSQAAILLSFTSIGHIGLGTVDWALVGSIWFGSLPGVLLGAKLCQFVSQEPLRALLYTILMMVSWKLVV
mgnify:CR=1 FL=1